MNFVSPPGGEQQIADLPPPGGRSLLLFTSTFWRAVMVEVDKGVDKGVDEETDQVTMKLDKH